MNLAPFFSLAQTAPAGSNLLGGMLPPMLAMGVIFYFLIIRPQGQRQKELKNLIASLKTGDKVVTSSGMHGIIANVKEGGTLLLKVADNVKIEINKDAIATVVKDPSASAS
jgi:preprotein translocase subunit YajC